MESNSVEIIEELCKQLLNQARELGVAVTGAIALPQGKMVGFDNKVLSPMKPMNNIRALVAVKGEITPFIMGSSAFESQIGSKTIVSELEESQSFTLSNPQVTNTKH